MDAVNPKLKNEAEEKAKFETEQERRRIDNYRSLRYNYTVTTVDAWLNDYYEAHKATVKLKKNPTWNQIRKDAGIGFFENIFSSLFVEKKKTVKAKQEQSRKKLQLEVDEVNKRERERCSRINNRLEANASDKYGRFIDCDKMEIEEYFCYALHQDYYQLDRIECSPEFNLLYVADKKRLVIDYELPLMDQISKVKEWKVGKDLEIMPKDMNKADYLDMYERILFDLSLRTVGILFCSDDKNILNEIVFNGSCVYSDWQHMPTIIVSFLMAKNQFSLERIRGMECDSKSEIAKLDDVRYLGDIHSIKPPVDLWDTPPVKLVVPIQSSFR